MKSLGMLVTVIALLAVGCATSSPVGPDAPPAAANATTFENRLLGAALLNSGQTGEHVVPTTAPTRTSQIEHVPFFIQDANGLPPAAPGTPLFEAQRHNPILAPDGHQVTLAEFNAVEGEKSVKCVSRGTHVVVQLRHLIPNGVYTIWNVVFKAPGFDPTFSNLIGFGALGSPSGTQNVFTASTAGEGAVSAITGPGPLSLFGSIATCALTGEFEWHVVGAYHIDGQSHGPSPGPEGSAVNQFAFISKN